MMLLPLFMLAQEDAYKVKDNAVIVEKVIPFDGAMSDAVLTVRDYFVKQLKDSNETLKLAGEDIIIVKVVTPVLHTYNMGTWATRGELTIEAKFKDSRMKVIVTCDDVLNYSQNGKSKQTYNPVDAAPLNPDHDIWKINITKKAATETFEKLVGYMNSVVADVENAMAKAKEDEDW